MTVFAKVGYVRVSTIDQNTGRQLSGIELDRIFEDKASAKDTNRPQLMELLRYVRQDDHVYIHSMDRLARNLSDLLRLVTELTNKGVTVHFVKENLTFAPDEKTAPMAKLMLSMLGAVAEFERSMILERQREGINLAKARGAYKGRRPLSDGKIEAARQLLLQGKSKVAVCKELGIGRTSLYKYLK